MFLTSLIQLALMLAAATETPAVPSGTWLTEEGKGRVEIERCGDDLCGTIVELTEPFTEEGKIKRDANNPDPTLRDRPVVGIEALRIPAEPDDNGVWRNGSIYDPEDGKTYKCKMWLDDENTLRIRGFVGVSLLGRTVEWQRVGKSPDSR